MSRLVFQRLLSSGALLCCACGEQSKEPPDLSALVSRYDEPTGTIGQDDLPSLIRHLATLAEKLNQAGSIDFIVETLDQTFVELQDTDDAIGGDALQLSADIVVTRPCATSDGALQFQLQINQNYLQPTIWGHLSQCRVSTEIADFPTTTAISMHLGSEQHLTQLALQSLLVSLEKPIVLADEAQQDLPPWEVHHFRIWHNALVETSFDTRDGAVVAGISADREHIQIRTGRGSLCCIMSDRSCFYLRDDQCSPPQAGDEKWSW